MGLLSYGCSRFRCELNWNSVMILRRVEIRKKPGEKPPRAREITIRNLNLHVTTTPGFEPIGKSHLTAAPICMGLRTRILIFFCSKLINKCLYLWITQAARHFRSWNNHVEMEVSRRVRGSKTVLNPGFLTVDSEFQLLDSSLWSLPVELGFWIPTVCGIPDSLSCIPNYKAQKIFFRIPEIGFPYVGWKVRSHLR